jgi:hypothetical protein
VGSMHPPNRHRHRSLDSSATRPDANSLELDALLEENKQLREFVVQLSEIVLRSVLDRK